MITFKKNKKFHSLMNKTKDRYWVDEVPMWISEDGETGLYGAYKAGGPYGVLPKNPSEIVLRENRPLVENENLKTRKEVDNIKDKIW